jgi:hypothetical protein
VRLYLDVGVVRIQEYLTRTSGADGQQLRRRRGASRMVTDATDPGAFASFELERNDEAYHVEGVAHLRSVSAGVDASTAGDLALRVARQVRDDLPHAYVRASWAMADTYGQAHPLLARARAGDADAAVAGVLEVLPPLREDPFGGRCDACGLAAVDEGNTCRDCTQRSAVGGAQRPAKAPATPEARTLADVQVRVGRPLKPIPDLGHLAALVSADGVKANHLATVYADGNSMGRLFESISDRTVAREVSIAVDSAIRSAGAQALAAIFPLCRGDFLPGQVSVLAADDAVMSVPAPLGWLFARELVAAFDSGIAQSTVISALVTDSHGSVVRPSLTAGIAFTHVKSPIEAAIQAADSAMRRAKTLHPGEAAFGWWDLTHPDGPVAPTVSADWLTQHRNALLAVAALPSGQRARWEGDLDEGLVEGIDPARLAPFLAAELTRLGFAAVLESDLDLDDFRTLLRIARWGQPITQTGGEPE